MSQRASIQLREVEAATARAVPEPPRLAVAAQAAAPSIDLAQLSITARGPATLDSREALRRRLLASADVVAMTAALLGVVSGFAIGLGALTALASIPVVLVAFRLAGLYNRDELRLHHSTLDEAPALLQLTALFGFMAMIISATFSSDSLTAAQMGALWIVGFLAVLGGRVVARSVARRMTPGERCLIVGEARRADRIRERIASSWARATVVDCLAGDDIIKTDGGLSVIQGIVRDLGIDRIIIAPNGSRTDDASELIRIAKGLGVRVSVVPETLEVVGSAVALDELEGMAMLGLPRLGLCRSSEQLKRLLDLVATAVGLVLVAPVIAAIAVAIRIDSKGPTFFLQTRIGRHGKPFRIVKFRSMVMDAEAQKDQLRARSMAGPGLFKVKNDPRVTRLGRFLRASSLDELPQLFNVLRGDMTLVGPRPLVPDEDVQVLGLDRSRLLLTPGLTGPWQLMGARVPLQEMVEIDYFYASSWSLWLDLKILLRTLRHVVRRGNV
jgi:exopolysaccharide biosynthesis polyprenyl glycosylphosphotransferase